MRGFGLMRLLLRIERYVMYKTNDLHAAHMGFRCAAEPIRVPTICSRADDSPFCFRQRSTQYYATLRKTSMPVIAA